MVVSNKDIGEENETDNTKQKLSLYAHNEVHPQGMYQGKRRSQVDKASNKSL